MAYSGIRASTLYEWLSLANTYISWPGGGFENDMATDLAGILGDIQSSESNVNVDLGS